jgi:hypothetical protein
LPSKVDCSRPTLFCCIASTGLCAAAFECCVCADNFLSAVTNALPQCVPASRPRSSNCGKPVKSKTRKIVCNCHWCLLEGIVPHLRDEVTI